MKGNILFSFLKKISFHELETISENKASEKAAKELGLKISYQESKESHVLPPEHFKCVIIEFKNVPHETKIKFEELQQEYQHQEYQKMLRHIAKKIIVSTAILGAIFSAVTVSTCLSSDTNSQPQPTPVQKQKMPHPLPALNQHTRAE